MKQGFFSADDFLQGQKDCQSGKKHESGHSTSYDRGFSTQKEWEEVLTAMSLQQEEKGRIAYEK